MAEWQARNVLRYDERSASANLKLNNKTQRWRSGKHNRASVRRTQRVRPLSKLNNKTQRWRSGKHNRASVRRTQRVRPLSKLNNKTQRWRSGRTRTTRNRVTGNCTGVQIPLSAPKGTQVECLRLFYFKQ